MRTKTMDSIEKLLKTGRPAKPPEHNFQIIFEGSEPKLVDVKQLERDAKEYQKSKEIIKIIEKREEEEKLRKLKSDSGLSWEEFILVSTGAIKKTELWKRKAKR